MNYANDPHWAWKDTMDPYKRQAYENQVMADRAVAERHRTQFDAAATVGSVLLLADWFRSRDARKRAKERDRYIRSRCPSHYEQRRIEFESSREQLYADTMAVIPQLEIEQMQLTLKLSNAGTAKSHRSIVSRLAAVEALIKDKRLAYSTGTEALLMQFSDIAEYEAGLMQFS